MTLRLLTWIILLGFFGTQISCKRQRISKSDTSTNRGATDSTQAVADESVKLLIQSAELDFDYLKLKSKIALSSPNLSQNFPATIQVKKDSVIWISVAVGIEVARGIITPDSAIFLDRLNRNVYRFGYKELSEFLQFDVSYNLLQSLFIGNMPVYIRKEDVLSTSTGLITVKQQIGDLTLENIVDQITNKLTTVIAQKARNPNRLTITYGDFTDTDKGKLPQRINTKVENILQNGEVMTSINIEHTKVEFLSSNLSFPFSVPKSYNEVKLQNK